MWKSLVVSTASTEVKRSAEMDSRPRWTLFPGPRASPYSTSRAARQGMAQARRVGTDGTETRCCGDSTHGVLSSLLGVDTAVPTATHMYAARPGFAPSDPRKGSSDTSVGDEEVSPASGSGTAAGLSLRLCHSRSVQLPSLGLWRVRATSTSFRAPDATRANRGRIAAVRQSIW